MVTKLIGYESFKSEYEALKQKVQDSIIAECEQKYPRNTRYFCLARNRMFTMLDYSIGFDFEHFDSYTVNYYGDYGSGREFLISGISELFVSECDYVNKTATYIQKLEKSNRWIRIR